MPDTSDTAQPQGTIPSASPAGAMQSFDPASYIRSLEAAQQARQNTQGMTQIGPQLPQQLPEKKSNFSARGLPGLIMGIGSMIEGRKSRERQQIYRQFVGSAKGVDDAKAQIQQGQQAYKEAVRRLQSDPSDPEAAKAVQQAIQTMKQAGQALKINQTNLKDMFDGPKGEKHYKTLAKGLGIDDKNAGTPERQDAINIIKEVMGVDGKAANLLSHLPQTQQLTPQAQGQAMMQQAGVVGKPATAGQELTAGASLARTQQQAVKTAGDQTIKAEQIASKAGLDTQKQIDALPEKGLQVERDDKGNVLRNPDGTLKVRNLTMAELKDNPVLAEKYQQVQSQINLRAAQAQSTLVRASVARQKEQRLREQQAQAAQPAVVKNWADLVTDPKTGVTLANVPAAMRGAVVNQVAKDGGKIQKPLTGEEWKRADLASNAVDNIKHAQEILARRPDMFGPAGWGKTKFEMALAGGDKDAVDFQADIRLANLPAVGVHGVRGKWAIEDLAKLDGNLYLNAESMGAVLGDISRSAGEFADSGGRKGASGSGGGSGKIVVSAEDMK